MSTSGMPKIQNAIAIRAYDYLAAVIFGVTAALVASILIPDATPRLLAMVLGMVVGMASAFPVLALLTFVLGGFEIFALSMQVGMFAGMVGAMTGSEGLFSIAAEGAMVGLLVQLLLHAVDRSLRGEVELHV